jgi:hypothetical protein
LIDIANNFGNNKKGGEYPKTVVIRPESVVK